MATSGEKEPDIYSLEDDKVKLVGYTIVSLRRGHERIMEGGEGSVIVTDSMTGETFTSWIIAKYLQQEVTVPSKPKQTRAELISPGELKYLTVYYVVSKRWPRHGLAFEQSQVRVLKQIRDELAKS
ncbi:MAG TPA: hypothetical protein VKD65_10460 [Candidatus Angelobacter sp.]|nr:hypothetical protein [Candidatus Angelobacter sp.]